MSGKTLGDKIKDVGEDIKDKAVDLKEKAKDACETAGDKLTATKHEAEHKVNQAGRDAKHAMKS